LSQLGDQVYPFGDTENLDLFRLTETTVDR